MLTPFQVAAIKRLSAKGLSQRDVAKRLKLSRGSVQAVVAGKHCSTRRDFAHGRDFVPGMSQPFPRDDDEPRRCHGCGAMVYGDCIACWLRREIRRGTIAGRSQAVGF